MAARRCSDCGINYPNRAPFLSGVCPVHLTTLNYFPSTEPDEDWAEEMSRRQELTASTKDPSGLSTLDELLTTIETRVLAEHGHLFVSAWDVYHETRSRLRPGDLFRVGAQTFEVLEYLEEPRRYWVRAFETELSEETLRRLAGD